MSGPTEPRPWGSAGSAPDDAGRPTEWIAPRAQGLAEAAAPSTDAGPGPDSYEPPQILWGPPPAAEWGAPTVGPASHAAPPGATDWAPPTAQPQSRAQLTPAASGSRPLRSQRWLTVLATLATCLAILVFTGGFQYARGTFRYEQAPPGMAYSADGATAQLLSIVAAPRIKTGTSKDEVAPAGTVFVVARVLLSGENALSLCGGRLVLSDGRTLREAFVSKPDAVSCGQVGKKPVTEVALYYLVPEQAVGQIVGLAPQQRIGLARTTVLRPPA